MAGEVASEADSHAAEQVLLTRLRAGDEEAFETLVSEHGARLWSLCKRFFADDSDANDALQDTFLSAFRGLPNFDGKSRLGTWLHRIAVNASLMKLRSRQRHPERPITDFLTSYKDDGHRTEPVAPWFGSASSLLQQKDTQRLVREAIDELPETYRTVLLLRDIEEMDTQTVAELLDVSENVIKTRLHRARQALRTLLDRHFRGGAL